ncbi:MAG: hypothetical protein HC807_06010 [Gammaproteobacteria bacterium]|nr:hypothetical protein [Gammaproteobacteria bacterium]
MIVKHTGFEVAPGDELNGITFNAVGSGTVVENVQAYSTYDDGFEFFGGAVNVTNAIALYVRDDSLDYSDGYVGTITNALVIHWQTDGNRCIEGDNIGSARSDVGQPLDTTPLTSPTIRNMTCITSNTDVNTHGDSEGVLPRQGAKLILENSIVYSGYGTTVNGVTSNECYEIDDNDNVSRAFAAANDSFRTTNTVIACELPAQDNLPNGDTILSWLQRRESKRRRRGLFVQRRQRDHQCTDQRQRARAAAEQLLHGPGHRRCQRHDRGGERVRPRRGAEQRRLDQPMGVRPAREQCRPAAVVRTLT